MPTSSRGSLLSLQLVPVVGLLPENFLYTIPPDVAMTAQKPDLVIINRKSKEVKLVELLVPWDTKSKMTAALQRKRERYENLATEIKGNGFRCSNIPLSLCYPTVESIFKVKISTLSTSLSFSCSPLLSPNHGSSIVHQEIIYVDFAHTRQCWA